MKIKYRIIEQTTNKIIKLLFVFLLQTTATAITNAQGIEIKAEFDTSAILIGDQINLNILIDQPQDAKILFPVLVDSLVSKVEILSASKTEKFISKADVKIY